MCEKLGPDKEGCLTKSHSTLPAEPRDIYELESIFRLITWKLILILKSKRTNRIYVKRFSYLTVSSVCLFSQYKVGRDDA